MDRETIAFYDAEAAAYADTMARDWPDGPPMLARFAARLAPGGRVLDLGCGPGQDAARLAAMGFAVDAMDASEGLAAEARRRHGIAVRVASFDALDAEALYDGVWAAFSLLHDSRAALPRHLARIARALKPGGALYLGLKEGEGEARDSLGRRYFYVRAAEIAARLAEAGFAAPEIGRDEGTGMAGTREPLLHVLTLRAGETDA